MRRLASLLHPGEVVSTLGDRISDRVAASIGSWPFIILQSLLLGAWIFYNSVTCVRLWHHQRLDPYPFILCNLFLSFQAAYTGPVVMMSQNRQARKDRQLAELTYHSSELLLAALQRIQEQLGERS